MIYKYLLGQECQGGDEDWCKNRLKNWLLVSFKISLLVMIYLFGVLVFDMTEIWTCLLRPPSRK